MNQHTPDFDDLIDPDHAGGAISEEVLPITANLPIGQEKGSGPRQAAGQYRRARREAEAHAAVATSEQAPWWRRVSRTQWLGGVTSGIVLAVGVFLVLLLVIPAGPDPTVYHPSGSPTESAATSPLLPGTPDSLSLHDLPWFSPNAAASANPGAAGPDASRGGSSTGSAAPGPTGKITTPSQTPTPTPPVP